MIRVFTARESSASKGSKPISKKIVGLTTTLALVFVAQVSLASSIVFMSETDDQKRLMIADSIDSEPRFIETEYDFNIYPDISHDGTRLAFIGGSDQNHLNVVVKDLRTGDERTMNTFAGSFLHPHLAGGVNKIAFAAHSGERFYIEVRGLFDEYFEKIENPTHNLFFPQLNSDATFMVYQVSHNREKREIFIHTFEDRKNTKVDFPSNNCMSPAISFDDVMIAANCKIGDVWNIFVFNRVSKEFTKVTDDTNQTFAPTFDRQGNIVFASNSGEGFDLFRIDFTDGKWKKPQLLLDREEDLYSPSLSGLVNFDQEKVTRVPSPARSSFGAIVIGDELFIIGGHQGAEHTYPPESFLARVDIYNFVTGNWRRGADRPASAHGYDVETCGENIYAFGGFAYSEDHKPAWKSLARVDRYNPRTDKWEYVGDMPRKRSSNVVARVGSKIYLIGGWDATPQSDNDYEGTFHREVDVFDCKSESFVESDITIPDPLRRAFTGIVRNNKILLVGGLGVGATHFELLDNVTEFDPTTKTFGELSPLAFATFAPAVGLLDQTPYVFGGMFRTGERSFEYVNHIFAMDNEWVHTGRHLTESKGFSMVVEHEGDLYIVGGHSYMYGPDAPVPTVERFGPTK